MSSREVTQPLVVTPLGRYTCAHGFLLINFWAPHWPAQQSQSSPLNLDAQEKKAR